ncbi:hypothetical protein [Sodalinema gerasimenkoae]|uniref:hypothetical protein n=1 Tax=Sodalinema gerasimenkoae TaxID=2862348 RepID=UPI00135AFE6E|nr:hypothetical protein [Sodalinema gerasimenkoae]
MISSSYHREAGQSATPPSSAWRHQPDNGRVRPGIVALLDGEDYIETCRNAPSPDLGTHHPRISQQPRAVRGGIC